MDKEPEERRTCPICGHVFKSRAVMRNHYINRVCERYRDIIIGDKLFMTEKSVRHKESKIEIHILEMIFNILFMN